MPIKHIVLMILAGGIFPLGLAPYFLWPITLLSLGLLFYVLSTTSTWRTLFAHTWWFSAAKFATGVSWIYVSMHDHGGTSAWLSVLIVAAFACALALLPALIVSTGFWLARRTLSSRSDWFVFACLWVVAEWVRSGFLTGFPWLFAGDSHLNSPLSGWAPVIGSYGLSFISALSATALLQIISHGITKRPTFKVWLPICLVLPLWPIGYALNNTTWTTDHGQLTVTAVQGNIDQELKWKRSQIGRSLHIYAEQTRKHWDSDVIIWPETAVTVTQTRFESYRQKIAAEARQHHSTIIYGLPYRHPASSPQAGSFHNSVMVAGDGEGIYHKQKLVPFGEFVPFEAQIRGLIPFFDLEMSSFLAGDEHQQPIKVTKTITSKDGASDTQQDFYLSPFICYEIAYPKLVRTMAKKAGVLMTISNDAWFGDSLGPKQHMALAQMRALETQRPVVRATNTGITGIIDAHGRIVSQVPTNTIASATYTVTAKLGETPYMRFGLMPIWALMLAGLSVAWLVGRKQQRQL